MAIRATGLTKKQLKEAKWKTLKDREGKINITPAIDKLLMKGYKAKLDWYKKQSQQGCFCIHGTGSKIAHDFDCPIQSGCKHVSEEAQRVGFRCSKCTQPPQGENSGESECPHNWVECMAVNCRHQINLKDILSSQEERIRRDIEATIKNMKLKGKYGSACTGYNLALANVLTAIDGK